MVYPEAGSGRAKDDFDQALLIITADRRHGMAWRRLLRI
jgi:hypothetical protein